MATGTETLTVQQKQEIEKAFQQFDKDKDGLIYFEEIGEMLRVLGQIPTESDIANITKKHSSGTNEQLNLNDMYRILDDIGLKSSEDINQELIEAFRVIDKSGDGFISKLELRQLLSKHEQDIVTGDDFDAIMLAADVNQDGKLDYKEFVRYLTLSN